MVIDRARRKLHKSVWLLRYWVLDKYREPLGVLAVSLACILATGCVVMLVLALTRPPKHPDVVLADGGISIYVYLIMLIIAASVLYASRPKIEPPSPGEGKTPEVRDGKAIRRIYGEVWTDDSAIVAPFGSIPPEPIRKKGGKK